MQERIRSYEWAHRLQHASREHRLVLFRSLPHPLRAAIMRFLSTHVQQEILASVSLNEAVEVLDYLDLHVAQALIASIKNASRRNAITTRLKTDLKEKAERFVSFHPKATIELVRFDYILLPESESIGAAADALAAYRHDTGRFPEILVHRSGELAGGVSLNALIRERNQVRLKKVLEAVPTILYDQDPRTTLHFFMKSPHAHAVVMDTDGSVIGIIYADDVIKFFDEQGSESLYDFAGVADSERPFDTVRQKVNHRWKWLLLNLVTAFIAAGAVSLFEDTIAQVVILAAYLPIVAGMGGNAATQTLAVMVRGITTGDISFRKYKQALINEVVAGAINGLITGAVVAVIASVWNANTLLGLVVAISMVVNLIVAGFFGTIIPLILKHLGKDPATSAAIFITTATDVCGFVVFLGLAKLLLF